MSTFNSNFIIEESKKKDKSPSINKLVLDIIKTSNSKEEMVRKLKEIDKNGGGTGWKDTGYMKHDIFNALISCCLGVPSGFAAAAMTPLGLAGVPVGLLGLYLTGQVFHIKATKYDKFHLLEHYEKKMKSKKKILEKALDKEKDPKVKAEIQNRIKEADKCIKACDKERRKLLPPKVASKAEEFDDLDDFDFDFDDDWDDWEDMEIDEACKDLIILSEAVFPNNFVFLDINKNKQEVIRYLKQKRSNYTNYINNYNGEIIIDRDNDKIVGQVFIGKAGTKDHGFITGLEVYKPYKNKGFGNKLLDDAVKKYGGIDLTVYKNNEVAIKMYEKYGFVVIGPGNTKNSDYYMKLKSKLGKDDKIVKESTLLESKISKSKCNPVYIITMEGKSFISKPIKTFTHSEFSHAGLSLTPDLSKIFSFNMRQDTSVSGERKGGLSLESIDGYNNDNPTGRLKVNAVFLKNKDFKILKDKLDYMIQNAVDTSYNVIGLFDVVINKAVETGDNMSMVCSQFVDYMFKLINVDLTSKSSNLVAPSDIAKIENPKVYKLFDGIINEFKPSIIKNRLNKLYNKAEYIKENSIMSESLIEPIFESKKNFDIKFSEEGDLIISKRDKLDIEEEHSKSKRLYPIYKKNNNLEAMKYEAAKLYYMNSLIVHKLNGMNYKRMSKQREELITLRSKVLNEYSLYIRYITSKETDFNFTSYYRNSPFCTAEMKITKRTLKNILDSILLITSVF